MIESFDNDVNNIDEPNEEINEENEDFDIDNDIDDYEGQDEDINNSGKKEIIKDDDDDVLFDLNDIDEFEKKFTTTNNQIKKKSSGYPIISSNEYAKLYGLLTTYIVDNKISVPKDMEDLEIIKSSDAFRIAKYWLDNRKIWPIPMELEKHLYDKTIEMVNPNKLETHDDLSFHDDNNDEYRYDYNFHDEPYDTGY